MTSMKIILLSRAPTSSAHLRPKFLHSLPPAPPPIDFGRSILNKPPSPTLSNATMEQQPHRACEHKKLKQNKKTKPNKVTFKLITHSIVRFSSQTMRWHH